MQFSDVGSSVLVLAKDTVHAPLGAATSNQTDGVVESFAEVQSAQTQANVPRGARTNPMSPWASRSRTSPSKRTPALVCALGRPKARVLVRACVRACVRA